MTTTQHPATTPADAFGRAVARRLASSTDELPYEVRERLRAARVRAVAHRKVEAKPQGVVLGRGAGALGLGGEEFGLWHRLASAVPLLVLAVGLVVIYSVQNDIRASEVAEIDAAILTDDLPPAAYADPGFVQFLKQSWRE